MVTDRPVTAPPEGWYPDPSGRFALRWWDGRAWTAHVTDGRTAGSDPVAAEGVVAARTTPAPSPVTSPVTAPAPGADPVFPLAALWVALAGLVGGLVAATFLALPVVMVREEADVLAGAVAMLGLYVGFAGAGWVASKQWGTGRPLTDLGVRFVRADAGWGPLAAVGALAASIAVAIAVSPFPELEGTNTSFVSRHAETPVGVVLVLAATMVGAPIFEEVFFRGLVLRSLRSRMGAVPAVTLQALFFGLVHVQPGQGLGTLSVVAATAGIGAVLGITAVLARRLGPGMIGHALFNGLVVVPLLLGT